jgi:Protein of unknown function (DUF642)
MALFNVQLGLKVAATLVAGILPLSIAAKPAAAIVAPASTPTSTSTNLITNGSFENQQLANGSWGVFNSIDGWNLLEGSQAGIEVQHNAAGTAFDGNQLVELDSYGVSGIFQDLATTVGKKYKLKFAFSPRAGVAENTLNVKWGGNLVDTLTANGTGLGDTKWNTFTYNLVANDATTRLSFDNLTEKSDSLGTYIDNVSLQAVPESTNVAGIAVLGAIGLGSLCKRKKLLPEG